jgi:hypothetical protein
MTWSRFAKSPRARCYSSLLHAMQCDWDVPDLPWWWGREFRPQRPPDVSTVTNPQIGAFHAKSSPSTVRNAADNGQRRRVFLATHPLHLHIQVRWISSIMLQKNIICWMYRRNGLCVVSVLLLFFPSICPLLSWKQHSRRDQQIECSHFFVANNSVIYRCKSKAHLAQQLYLRLLSSCPSINIPNRIHFGNWICFHSQMEKWGDTVCHYALFRTADDGHAPKIH